MRLVALVISALLAALIVGVFLIGPSADAQSALDSRAYQRQHVGEPTQILVLGTPHLSETPSTFDPAVLEPFLTHLQAFHPDAICIETLPDRSIDQMWRYRETYPEVASTYGARASVTAAMARNGVELDMPGAEAEVRRTLATWPASPTPVQRRRLAALFAAAGDPASALVQWWRLDAAERKTDQNAPQQLVDLFATYETPPRRNENYLIASRLGVRLGLERIYPMDDQSDDIASPTYAADYDPFTNEPWFQTMLNSPSFKPLREAAQHLTTPAETLETYRFVNSPATGRADADGQWLSLINRQSPHDAGRSRVAAWEVRNLRMAANIREVSDTLPGKRVLVIVGFAHKAWLEAYLGMMSDVRIVDAERVLP